MTKSSRKFLLGAGMLALSATAAAAVPAVVETDLNLRSGPGTQYAVIGSLPGGATVDVGSCTGNWCTVAYGGEQGYASRSYLNLGAAGAPVVTGPAYGYVEPEYYYDDYYYGYGPGVTLGFGYWGGRDYYHRGRWHRGRGHGNWGRDHVGRGPGRNPGGPNVGTLPSPQGYRTSGSLGSGTVSVGRPAPSISTSGWGRGGASASAAPSAPRSAPSVNTSGWSRR